MALVADGFEVTVSLMDNGGDITRKTYQLTTTIPADAIIDAGALVADLIAVTDATVLSFTVGQRYVEDAFAFPASGVENQNQALLVFQLADNPTKKATHSIPAPSPGIFVAASGPNAEVVDLADAAVIAYAANFLPGGIATLSDGESADALISGRRIHRQSRRG